MARKKSVVSQEGSPVLFEVWKWDSKIELSGSCIPSEYELEDNFSGAVDIYLVERPMTEDVGNYL